MEVKRLYQRMPPILQTAVATARGWQLRGWRYGAETETLVSEALQRDRWSEQQWEEWQEARLEPMLRRAATQVPYYRSACNGRKTDLRRLDHWSILEKETLRENPTAFLADGVQRSRLFHDHTSGTTGKSLDLWFDRATVRNWYALFEARCRRWYGVSRHDHWGILGGQLVTAVHRRKPPFWVWNAAMHQLYLSVYHLAPDLVPHYVDAIRSHRLVYLLGYTSALYSLAQGILESDLAPLHLKVVVTNAEPLFEHQREVIGKAFGCPVRETYGLAETVAAASECEAGRLHLWPEAGVTEVLNESGEAVAAGQPGHLVATGLLNENMPLIRYRVGDQITMARASDRCPCGRTLPLVERIEGRADDVLLTRDGRQVGRLDPVFKASLAVREAQIIQESLDRVRILYVPAREFSAVDADSICTRLRERMGDVDVTLEKVPAIPRGTNGKFRSVIRRFPKETPV
jgi:phenylacetate-CoA ligase